MYIFNYKLVFLSNITSFLMIYLFKKIQENGNEDTFILDILIFHSYIVSYLIFSEINIVEIVLSNRLKY